MKYGRSLSFCVKDILSGKVSINEVGKIVTSTACKNAKDWKELIALYSQTYWNDFSSLEIENVMTQLISDGKIEQPRLSNGKIQALYLAGIWADSYGEVIETLRDF
jgi:hypothetical protein